MVKTFFIFESFEIYSVNAASWKKSTHRHNFFELLYIAKGSGIHTLNANHHTYRAHNIYLLTPQDIHSFKTQTPTQFHCLRFLPGFFSNPQELNILENVFHYHNQTQGPLSLSPDDAQFCECLIQQILQESIHNKRNNLVIIRHLMASILEVIKRNVWFDNNKIVTQTLKIDQILQYIRLHIASPQLLKKSTLAHHFNVSAHYIGEYFKKHVDITLQEFIIETRLSIITEKLKQSHLSFAEVSHELGFKDSSHFNKFVKKHTGQNPSQFRNSLKYEAS